MATVRRVTVDVTRVTRRMSPLPPFKRKEHPVKTYSLVYLKSINEARELGDYVAESANKAADLAALEHGVDVGRIAVAGVRDVAAEQIERATQRGGLAHAEGRQMIAAHDAAVMAMIAGRKVGVTPAGEADTLAILGAFNTAWHAAHGAMLTAEYRARTVAARQQ